MRKQIIIAGIFFVLIGGLSYFAIILNRETGSCFDNAQNQGETGIDCGGSCAPCLADIADPLKVEAVRFLAAGGGKWDAAAFVENPNLDLAVAEVTLNWRILDREGDVMKVVEEQSYLLPRQRKIFPLINLELSKAPQEIELSLSGPRWIKAEGIEIPGLLVKDVVFEERALGRKVVAGNLVNKSPFGFDTIEVVSVASKDGKILGINSSELNTVTSGEERFFELSWFREIGEPDDIRVETYTDVFDKDNFLRREGGLEEFQKF